LETSIRERDAQFFFTTAPGRRNIVSNVNESGFQVESQKKNKNIAALIEVSAREIRIIVMLEPVTLFAAKTVAPVEHLSPLVQQ
jgi:predicted regulator of amino acid metabolism with ACT domain